MNVEAATRAIRSGRPSLLTSARVLLRLTWASTYSAAVAAGVLCLVALPVAFAALFASRGPMSGDAVTFLVQRYDQLVVGLAMPVIALLAGTSAFGGESDDGTLLYIVTTPTPRWWIVLCRVAFAAAVTAIGSAVAVLASGHLAHGAYDRENVTGAFLVAVLFGSSVYAALFVLLSLVTRRALVTGLGYILFWEGILAGSFPGIGHLSVRQWVLAVASMFTDAIDERMEIVPTSGFAMASAVVLIVLAVLISAKRLAEPRLARN